jgi:pilus assembly protein CpaE
MYPLTIGLAIENRDLWDQAQACLAQLPFRIIVEHQDVGDVSNFLDRLERMRPDVVLVDISGWKEPLEGLVSSIRAAAGDPMIVALNTTAQADAILSSLRAGINEYLFPPLTDTLRKALERRSNERSRRREGGTKGAGKAVGFVSAKGGCGATTMVCHFAQELGRQNLKVLLADMDFDAGLVGFITKTKSVYSILDAINNLHRLDIHYWKALVSNGIPGVEIVSSPLALAAKMQPRDDQIRQVLSFARPNYDWTLVDLGRGLGRIAMAAMEELDEVVLVTTLEVPALIRQIALAAAAQPRSQAPGHFDRRARKDAGHSHFRHRHQRLSGAVRDLRRRPDAESQFGFGQTDRAAGAQAGLDRRREDRKEALCAFWIKVG